VNQSRFRDPRDHIALAFLRIYRIISLFFISFNVISNFMCGLRDRIVNRAAWVRFMLAAGSEVLPPLPTLINGIII